MHFLVHCELGETPESPDRATLAFLLESERNPYHCEVERLQPGLKLAVERKQLVQFVNEALARSAPQEQEGSGIPRLQLRDDEHVAHLLPPPFLLLPGSRIGQ